MRPLQNSWNEAVKIESSISPLIYSTQVAQISISLSSKETAYCFLVVFYIGKESNLSVPWLKQL